ncbi:magnesium or manganese-dependent protein phosphatase [Streptomyces viridochromogenes DSM 40736]|uniref:Magnesium or manganese-dependent protein phosphatase n=1 Tax=Streptomyces viridochromogenes (strain DSM 40736 / JCM 4977 / BCRC 1201 / Tue 494) TaxID=591159 RepID=D9XDS7_STRVT|nr:magnesium or manganese-dependent protein phosphatase [Streptomyces viridochromogenes DSM 40736]
MRASILNSWQRCRTLGLSPDRSDLPYTDEFDPGSRIARAAVPVIDRLQATFSGSQVNISVADANGTVLLRRFGDPWMARSLPPIQVVPGFVFAEQVAGTNGIGLALAERQLIRVYGAEHFAERAQSNACVALPVRDPLSGRIEGVLCLGYPRGFERPALGAEIRRAAETIERRLLRQSSAHERALLRTYLATGSGDDLRHGLAIDALADTFHPRDQAILMEKAAELISRAQRAAVDVTLPDGRRVTLVSRPMTSASGVRGFAVEAVLPGTTPAGGHFVLPHQADEVPDLAALAVAPGPVRESLTLPPEPLPAAPGPVIAPAADRAPVEPGATVTANGDRVSAQPGATVTADGNGAAAESGGTITGAGAGAGAGVGGGGVPGDHPGSPFPPRGLVMVGEPHVGAYALAARRRLELLSEASARIGTTLDVRRTAEELAETAVPRLADHITIDLADAVLRGEESPEPLADLRRTVVHGIREDLPFTPPGERIDFGPTAPQLHSLTSGEAVLEPDLGAAAGWLAQDPEHTGHLLAHVHSLIAVPLLARGVVLGVASFYRAGNAFGDDDRSLAQELVARAALSIDNARQYTHERAMVLALQRRLLPHGLPDQDAVEVAHRYLPAESDVGGDWYDVIPLPGARVGLLVGDVVGHGMLSAATMGRLRTAARSFAELDFPPGRGLTTQPRGPAGPRGPRRQGRRGDRRDLPLRHLRPHRAAVPHGARRPPAARARPPRRRRVLPRPAGRAPARPRRAALRRRRDRPPREQPACPVHRRAHRGQAPRRRRGAGAVAHGPGPPGARARGDLPGHPGDRGARAPERRHRPARRPRPRPGPRPDRRLGAARRPGGRRRRPGIRPAVAGRPGARRDRVRRGAHPQRADHQRHPARRRAHPGAAAVRPHPRLRGLRRQ